MPQTTLLLLLLFPLLILILHSSSAIVANDPHYLDCSRPYRCSGTNINVSFPFRLPDSPSYCGVPGYDLYCSDFNSELSINLSGVNYRVKDISYTQGFITLVDSDFLDNLCPQSFTNTSINSTLFDFADFDFNLTVYINCTIPLPLPGLSEILCFADPIGLHSYYKLDKGSPSFLMDIGWCQLKAAVPVYERAAMSLNGSSAKFGEALQQGFGLKWNAGKGWCKGCIDSGGVCGYNSVNATDPTCFCPNNTAIGSCPYGRMEVITDVEGLTSCGLSSRFPLRIHTNSDKNYLFFRRRPGPFLVLASCEGPKLDKWEHIELKFDELLGEDPK